MKFIRHTAGYGLLDHRRNEDMLEELKVDLVKKKLAQYKQKCLNLLGGMEDIRYPKQFLATDLSEEAEEDLDTHQRDYYMDTIFRLKQVIYWPNFVTRRRRKYKINVFEL